MPNISVVIPVYKDDVELQKLLDALAFMAVSEIIIVDGEIRPRPVGITCQSPKKTVQWHNASQGRGAQISVGIEAATHPIIWVLHADSRPTAKCPAELTANLANPKTSLSCFPLAFPTPKLALALFVADADSKLRHTYELLARKITHRALCAILQGYSPNNSNVPAVMACTPSFNAGSGCGAKNGE